MKISDILEAPTILDLKNLGNIKDFRNLSALQDLKEYVESHSETVTQLINVYLEDDNYSHDVFYEKLKRLVRPDEGYPAFPNDNSTVENHKELFKAMTVATNKVARLSAKQKFLIGFVYFYGYGVDKDIKAGDNYLQQAANERHLLALHVLGVITNSDQYYERASKLGLGCSYYNLAISAADRGDNEKEVTALYESAVAGSQYGCGELLYRWSADNDKKNHKNIKKFQQLLVRRGDNDALAVVANTFLHKLHNLYQEYFFTHENEDYADDAAYFEELREVCFEFAKQLARDNNAAGFFILGKLFAAGFGIKADIEKAVFCLQQYIENCLEAFLDSLPELDLTKEMLLVRYSFLMAMQKTLMLPEQADAQQVLQNFYEVNKKAFSAQLLKPEENDLRTLFAFISVNELDNLSELFSLLRPTPELIKLAKQLTNNYQLFKTLGTFSQEEIIEQLSQKVQGCKKFITALCVDKTLLQAELQLYRHTKNSVLMEQAERLAQLEEKNTQLEKQVSSLETQLAAAQAPLALPKVSALQKHSLISEWSGRAAEERADKDECFGFEIVSTKGM